MCERFAATAGPRFPFTTGWRMNHPRSRTRTLRTRLRRALIAGAIAGAMGWAGAAPAWADPPVSALPRLPVCGDQDTSPVQLKCADFVPIPDIEVFRVPGQGPIDLTFDFVFSEASVPNELDVFQVDDLNGRIGTVSPAEAGYLPAALRARADAVPVRLRRVGRRHDHPRDRRRSAGLLHRTRRHARGAAHGEPGQRSRQAAGGLLLAHAPQPRPGHALRRRSSSSPSAACRPSSPSSPSRISACTATGTSTTSSTPSRRTSSGPPATARTATATASPTSATPVRRWRIPISATATGTSSVTRATIAWTSRTSHRATRTAMAAATRAASRSATTGATTTETDSSTRTIPAARPSTSRSSPSRPAARGSAPRSGYAGGASATCAGPWSSASRTCPSRRGATGTSGSPCPAWTAACTSSA